MTETEKSKSIVYCPDCGGAGVIKLPFSVPADSDRMQDTNVVCPRCRSTFVVTGNKHKFEGQVEGINAAEVSKVVKAMMNDATKNFSTNVSISGGTVGILNTGEIKDIESISVNVSSLQESGHTNIAEALEFLTEAVITNDEIAFDQRAELLELLDELSRQATLSPTERANPGIIKAVLLSLTTGITAVDKLTEAWSTWGHLIHGYFGF